MQCLIAWWSWKSIFSDQQKNSSNLNLKTRLLLLHLLRRQHLHWQVQPRATTLEDFPRLHATFRPWLIALIAILKPVQTLTSLVQTQINGTMPQLGRQLTFLIRSIQNVVDKLQGIRDDSILQFAKRLLENIQKRFSDVLHDGTSLPNLAAAMAKDYCNLSWLCAEERAKTWVRLNAELCHFVNQEAEACNQDEWGKRMPASSASSEGLFSSAGFHDGKRKGRALPERLAQQVKVSRNYQLFPSNDDFVKATCKKVIQREEEKKK